MVWVQCKEPEEPALRSLGILHREMASEECIQDKKRYYGVQGEEKIFKRKKTLIVDSQCEALII